MTILSSRLQWSKVVFLILLMSNADVIYANIQYAVSLCAKHTVSIRG